MGAPGNTLPRIGGAFFIRIFVSGAKLFRSPDSEGSLYGYGIGSACTVATRPAAEHRFGDS
jgi:hypothetical protein